MRKIFAKLLAGTLLVATLATSASAANGVGTFDYKIRINEGAQVSTNAERKTGTGMMWVSIKKTAGSTVNWLSSENVFYRGRDAGGSNQATILGQTTKPIADYSLGYLSGYGNVGSSYKLALQYDNSNPYTYLELTGSWLP